MINEFEEEMYSFFTTEESFLSMVKISEHYPIIRYRMVKEFWNEIEINLKNKIHSKGWKVIRVGKLEDGISKLMLYKSEWGLYDNCPQLAVCYERLSRQAFYGPFIHNHVANLIHEEGHKFLRALEIANHYIKDGSTWFPFYMDSSLNFTNGEDLLEIIPSRRAKIVEEYSECLYELMLKMEPELDAVHINNRITT